MSSGHVIGTGIASRGRYGVVNEHLQQLGWQTTVAMRSVSVRSRTLKEVMNLLDAAIHPSCRLANS